MQLPKFLKISLLVILFMAVAAYIVYAFVGMKSTNPDEICQEVTYVFEEEGADVVVDSTVVSNMLVEAGIFPQGKKMSAIDLKQIQTVITKNPFVTSVDCYGNNNGMEVGTSRLCVKVKQMVPLMLVFDSRNEHYYVDEAGNFIDSDSLYAKNLIVANGEINRNYVVSDLVPLAAFIKNDEFWNSQIEQIYVEYDKRKNRVVTLVPRVGDQKIFMGTLDKFDKKLVRLKKFYERGLSVVGWNKYSVLNLEYDNQVVGVIKGMEKKVDLPDEEEPAEEATSDNAESNNDEAKKKDDSKNDVKKDDKKDEPKKEAKKEEPKKEVKKEEPKKKDEPKKEVKKEESKKEVKKEEPKKEVKKEEPKKEAKKDQPKKKEEPKKSKN